MKLGNLFGKLDKIKAKQEVLKKAIGATCKDIQRDAVNNVPVDTGGLRRSIKTEVNVEGSLIIGSVFSNKRHAPYVEFGTGSVGEASKPNVPIPLHYTQDEWLVNIPNVGFRYIRGMKPQPYLYPALLKNKDSFTYNVIREVQKDMRKLKI